MADQKNNADAEKNEAGWLEQGGALAIALVVAILATAAYVLNFGASTSDDQGVWGQFGDFIGGLLNPVVALFALYMLGVTLRVQRRELEATREELEATRGVAEGQRKVMQRQLFESQFFSSLQLLIEIIAKSKALSIPDKYRREIKGPRPINSAMALLRGLSNLNEQYREHTAPIVSLVKIIANGIDRNVEVFDESELEYYAATLRGFITEYEAAVLMGAMHRDPPESPLKNAVCKFHLFRDLSFNFKQSAWGTVEKEHTVMLSLTDLMHDSIPNG